MSIAYKCDRCGVVFERDKIKKNPHDPKIMVYRSGYSPDYRNGDICQSCWDGFLKWWKAPDESVEPEVANEKPMFDYDSHYMCFAPSDDMPECIYNVHRQCTAPGNSWDVSHCKYRYLNASPEEEEEDGNET